MSHFENLLEVFKLALTGLMVISDDMARGVGLATAEPTEPPGEDWKRSRLTGA